MYYVNKEGEVTQKRLADLTFAKEPTITALIDRIQLLGYVRRVNDKRDKRRKIVVLTSKGKKAVEEFTQIALEFKEACLENISEEEQKVFTDVIDKITNSALEWRK